ncbi:MAG: alpha/beta fold hydrolase [Pseudomonadota bacterium]
MGDMLEPFDIGQLDVGDGHSIYYEQFGYPMGVPVVYLHGGPGSGCSDGHRPLFAGMPVRAILFDQRGCGRSTPNAGEDLAGLHANSLDHLISDMERLRLHLGIKKWGICGGSWGTTLGLNYALRHKSVVQFLLLAGVALTRRGELEWLYHHVGNLLPKPFEAFCAFAPEADTGLDRIRAYRAALSGDDPELAAKAARHWCDWEASVAHADGRSKRSIRWDNPAFCMTFARLVTHYFGQNNTGYDEEILMRLGNLGRLPTTLINSRLDLDTPLKTAHEVHLAIAGSKLVLLDGALHGITEKPVAEAIRAELSLLLDRTNS